MKQKWWERLLVFMTALIICCSLAVPVFAASKANDRSLGYTVQVLRKDQDVPEIKDEDVGVDSLIPIGVAVSFNNLNGDTGNVGIGTFSARNRAMNDSMGKADMYALFNPIRIGIAYAVCF